MWVGAALLLVLIGVVSVILMRGDPPRPDRERRPSRSEWLRERLFTLLRPVKLANCTLERFGEPHDGGYLVCSNLLASVESGYSYGISGYDQWGCDISRKVNVRVHQYDCFDTRQPACPGGDMLFHAECVGPAREEQDGRPFDTLAAQITTNGDRNRRLVLKIDVEGAEWDSFVLAPDWVFEQIDQLIVEFHGVESEKFIAAVQRLTRFFHVAHLHFNNFSCDPALAPFPASAYEVLFVNKKLAAPDPSGAAVTPHPLDTPNNPNAPDCQGGNLN
jgi:Methyltransferase domain